MLPHVITPGAHALLTWNFSSSEVTRPWALARGVWHLSIHWCTWDMESEGRLQHSALQPNMRPCSEEHTGETRCCCCRDLHRWHTSPAPTCILRIWSLSRLWTISSTTVCMRAWCASAISEPPTRSSLIFETTFAYKPDRIGCICGIHGKSFAKLLHKS